MQTAGQGGGVANAGDAGESETSQDDRRRLTIIVIAILLLLLFLLLLFLSSVYVAGMGGSGQGKSGTGQATAGDGNGTSGLGEAKEPAPDSQAPGAGNSPVVENSQDQISVTEAKEASPNPNAEAADVAGAAGQNGTEVPPPEAITATPEVIDAPQLGGATFNVPGSDFFGIKSRGNEFVYVIDCSGSMRGEKFARAKEELKNSIENLSETQSFSVLFFSDENFPMYFPNQSPGLVLGTENNKTKVEQWIDAFKTRGSTDPEESMLEALEYNPDVIYMLTDGAFASNIVDAISNANRNEVSINTIGFSESAQERNLKEIAQRNNGTYRKVR